MILTECILFYSNLVKFSWRDEHYCIEDYLRGGGGVESLVVVQSKRLFGFILSSLEFRTLETISKAFFKSEIAHLYKMHGLKCSPKFIIFNFFLCSLNSKNFEHFIFNFFLLICIVVCFYSCPRNILFKTII